MTQRCEVCRNFRPDAEPAPGQRLVEWAFGARSVTLCTGHARIARNSGVTSFEQLRELYGSGRRSFVPRRNPVETSPFGDRRSGMGRRASDHAG